MSLKTFAMAFAEWYLSNGLAGHLCCAVESYSHEQPRTSQLPVHVHLAQAFFRNYTFRKTGSISLGIVEQDEKGRPIYNREKSQAARVEALAMFVEWADDANDAAYTWPLTSEPGMCFECRLNDYCLRNTTSTSMEMWERCTRPDSVCGRAIRLWSRK